MGEVEEVSGEADHIAAAITGSEVGPGAGAIPEQAHLERAELAIAACRVERDVLATLARLEQLERLATDLVIVFVEFFGARAALRSEM